MNSFIKKERKLFIKEHEDEQYYYAILEVLEDRNREMLSVVNRPTEEMMYWKEELEALKERGVTQIDLMVSDALQGIETLSVQLFSSSFTSILRCSR